MGNGLTTLPNFNVSVILATIIKLGGIVIQLNVYKNISQKNMFKVHNLFNQCSKFKLVLTPLRFRKKVV